MKLYGYWRSSSSWRVHIALHHKGLAYQYQPVHLLRDGGEQHTTGYRAINPMAEVPTLEIEEAGQRRRITQSLAIIGYLERVAPLPPLIPDAPLPGARAWQLAEMINAGIQPLQNSAVLKRVKEELGGDPEVWARHFMTRGLSALEAIAIETAGKFLVGDSVSLADVCLIPQLYNARRYAVDLAAFPTLTRIEGNCLALPAFAETRPEKQIDAPPPAG
jgi:maleylpyruvate isomerase